jgi:hypothetical protein
VVLNHFVLCKFEGNFVYRNYNKDGVKFCAFSVQRYDAAVVYTLVNDQERYLNTVIDH